MQWDMFCRVVDNYGDIGVCWRLAANLAARAQRVRLWVDDASALRWMAPSGAAGVEVLRWDEAAAACRPGDVVVEAFGCDPPEAFVRCMAASGVAPVWINLEYLSAEDYVERCHGLPSPQLSGPGAGLTKWFFYPGFGPRSGGLLREDGLLDQQAGFDAAAWLSARGLHCDAGERAVSLFCYANAALPALLGALSPLPTLLLVAGDEAQRQVRDALGGALRRGGLRAALLPWLTQPDYDRLLWACELNFVRGEDSFVRAQWAGRPFVWQAYPQHDGAHLAKLDAFLDRWLAGADASWATALRALWAAWNGAGTAAGLPLVLPAQDPWRRQCEHWRARLMQWPELTGQLLRFAAEKR